MFRQGTKWYKFGDGDVTEVLMQDDEELKNQCFGGEYLSEVILIKSRVNLFFFGEIEF